MSTYSTRFYRNIFQIKINLGYEKKSKITKISLIFFDTRSNIALVTKNQFNQLDMIHTNIQKFDNLAIAISRVCDKIIDPVILEKSTRLYDEYTFNLIYIIDVDDFDNSKIFNYYSHNEELIWINSDQLYNLYLIKDTKDRYRHLDNKLHFNLIYTELYAMKKKRTPMDFKIARFNQPIFCYTCVKDDKYDEYKKYTNYKWIGAKRDRKELCMYCKKTDKSCRQLIKCDGCNEYIELFTCIQTVYTWCSICNDYNSCVDIEKCKKCLSYYFSSMHHRDKEQLQSFHYCYYCK
jgi:hypothetical protein